MARSRIISPMQWAALHGQTAFDLPTTIDDRFRTIWSGAHWELENLAIFNQAAYSNVHSRNTRLDEAAQQLREVEAAEAVPTDDEAYETFQIAMSRRREAIIAGELEVEAIARYADEVTVVATWAFVEKHLNEVLATLQTALGIPLSGSHRWPDIESGFVSCGVNLASVNGFSDADECRKVNNSIKHSGVVGPNLVGFPAFVGRLNDRIEKIELDTQRYFFGAGAFVSNSLHEASDHLHALGK